MYSIVNCTSLPQICGSIITEQSIKKRKKVNFFVFSGSCSGRGGGSGGGSGSASSSSSRADNKSAKDEAK